MCVLEALLNRLVNPSFALKTSRCEALMRLELGLQIMEAFPDVIAD